MVKGSIGKKNQLTNRGIWSNCFNHLFTDCVLPAEGSGEIHSVSRLSVGHDCIVLDQLVQSTINGNIGADIRQENQGLTAITVNNPSLLMPCECVWFTSRGFNVKRAAITC